MNRWIASSDRKALFPHRSLSSKSKRPSGQCNRIYSKSPRFILNRLNSDNKSVIAEEPLPIYPVVIAILFTIYITPDS